MATHQPTQFELFEAVETGDVATIERFFAQSENREAAHTTESLITDEVLVDLANSVIWENATIPHDAWVYLHDRRNHIFRVAITANQYELLEWLFTSALMAELLRTLQSFVVDALTCAIHQRQSHLVELLLRSRAWLLYPEPGRAAANSLLLKAGVECLNPVMLSILIAHGIDVNQRLPDNETVLCHAAARDHSGTVAFTLRDLGTLLVGANGPIHRAAEYGHREGVCTLLELGADPRGRDRQLETPLHRAAEEGYVTTLETLLRIGCVDIDAQNAEENTALNLAVQTNPFMDSDDENIESDDEDEDRGFHPQAIDVLLAHGANPEICSSGGYEYAPLHWAVSMGCLGVVRTLLTRGADANVRSPSDRQTPALLLFDVDENFHAAKLEMLELLVAFGADLTCEDTSGESPLGRLHTTEVGQAWLASHSIGAIKTERNEKRLRLEAEQTEES